MTEHHVTGYRKYSSTITNHVQQTAIWTFAALGIAELLAAADTPLTADELAQKQGWNSEFLYRLLRAVATADIVHEIKSDGGIELEKKNRFELTEDGPFFTSNHPSEARYILCCSSSPFVKTTSHYLPQLIREGFTEGSGFQRVTSNVSIFEYFKKEENREFAHIFTEAMTSFATYSGPHIVNAVDFSRFNKIVHVGGNSGALLSHILEKYPTIKQGICFDLPSVIAQSQTNNEFTKRNISKDRYEYVGGDMFDPKTIPQADAYILQNIIHDWTDDRSIDILRSIRIAADGQKITLFVIGFIIVPDTDENKSINMAAHAVDLQMMIILGAKERTVKQHEYLFEQSGFKFTQLYYAESFHSIIEAAAN